MVEIVSTCLASSSPNYVVDVSYKLANGNVNGDFKIEKEGMGGMWMLVDSFQASDTPSGGIGTVTFDCGSASNYSTGVFRYLCTLTDSDHSTPEEIASFPPNAC